MSTAVRAPAKDTDAVARKPATMGLALNRALRDAMAEDPDVHVFGEDVGTLGGVFRVTDGLAERFGPDRCGDTPLAERDWARQHGRWLFSNPDMLHRSLLPQHGRWASYLRRLRYVVLDECHTYRGLFGSHVALLLRRLLRVCARYGARPTIVLASATVAEMPCFSRSSAASSASLRRVPSERIATCLPSRTIRPLPISSTWPFFGISRPTPSPRGSSRRPPPLRAWSRPVSSIAFRFRGARSRRGCRSTASPTCRPAEPTPRSARRRRPRR